MRSSADTRPLIENKIVLKINFRDDEGLDADEENNIIRGEMRAHHRVVSRKKKT